MYFVYILTNLKGEFYKGITDNLDRRVNEHNKNKNIGTREKGPWKLIYFEELCNRKEARLREKYFKSGQGREFIKNLFIDIPL